MKKLFLSLTALTFSAIMFAQKTVADVAKFETEESITKDTVLYMILYCILLLYKIFV